ncbi:MAG: hypothetical protein J3K34DRAFT_400006, partial [Monoraphidium minutum]
AARAAAGAAAAGGGRRAARGGRCPPRGGPARQGGPLHVQPAQGPPLAGAGAAGGRHDRGQEHARLPRTHRGRPRPRGRRCARVCAARRVGRPQGLQHRALADGGAALDAAQGAGAAGGAPQAHGRVWRPGRAAPRHCPPDRPPSLGHALHRPARGPRLRGRAPHHGRAGRRLGGRPHKPARLAAGQGAARGV